MFNLFKKSKSSVKSKTAFSVIEESVVLKMDEIRQSNAKTRAIAIAEQRFHDGGLDWHVVQADAENSFDVINDFQLKSRRLKPIYTSRKGYNMETKSHG